ncbi:DUF1707 domain-containing protein [Enemella sp. A6]|uniref:DUF1707 domain-containing protein n=1 Tax=Enemella sp. A6 TaxID=3440152 RepID=UPI003EBA5197
MSDLARSGGTPSSWSEFTADPRKAKNLELRASDTDRNLVSEILADAFAEGRLDPEEYQNRLDKALSLRTLGEITPLVQDVWLAGRPSAKQVAPRSKVERGFDIAVGAGLGSWLVVAAITNVVWLATSLSGGFYYYWPIWPMLGVGIGVVVSLIGRWQAGAEKRLKVEDKRRRELEG